MHLLPVKTRLINPGDNLAEILTNASKIQKNDILVISSKAVATSEGRVVDLNSLTPSDEAKKYSEECGRTPAFCQAVLEEMKKRNGEIRGTCPGAIITELRPDGLTQGVILTANAGLDESNAPEGKAIGWSEDPACSAIRLRTEILENINKGKGKGARGKGGKKEKSSFPFSSFPFPLSLCPSPAVIITDSCVRPRRWGVTAYALAVSGIDPLKDEAGKSDLFGRKLRITKEAIADQLATAANMLMGNADQCTPAVIIRDHGIELSEFEGWVPGIEPEEDLFKCL